MPGGAAAIKKPYRMALGYLHALLGPDFALDGLPILGRVDPGELVVVRRQIERRVNSPLTSSAGRLFDAVSALLGIRGTVNYEGQAAIELELELELETKAAASEAPGTHSDDPYPLHLAPPLSSPYILDPAPIIRAVVADLQGGVPIPVISGRFHASMAVLIAEICGIIGRREGVDAVCLSGGVFQNMLLLERTVTLLEQAGFHVYTHHQVPANDGGLALGQAVVAHFRKDAT